MIVEKIHTKDAIRVNDLATTIRGNKGFGSTDLTPKRTIQTQETRTQISFLQARHEENTFLDSTDLACHLSKQEDRLMMTRAVITKVDMRKYNADFIEKVQEASVDDQDWQKRKREMVRLKEAQLPIPTHWQEIEGLLYYKNRLLIPNHEPLRRQLRMDVMTRY